MADEKTRKEQLLKQTSRIGSSPGTGNLLKGRFTKILHGVRDLFRGPGAKDGSKPQGGMKKAAGPSALAIDWQKLNLKSINQVLALILVGLISVTGYIVFRQRPDVSSVTAAVSKMNFQGFESKTVSTFQKIAFYLEQIETRDIFNKYELPKPPPPVIKPTPPPLPPKVPIQEKAKSLKLMGISWGDDPKAIISNQADNGMYFLREGENVKGTEIKVKKILKDTVIISSDGDEMRML